MIDEKKFYKLIHLIRTSKDPDLVYKCTKILSDDARRRLKHLAKFALDNPDVFSEEGLQIARDVMDGKI